jgi:AcrR family transcriptional regulator
MTADQPAAPAKPQGQWRHGNLREALIQLGTHVLDTEGSEALSLRAIAKLAGVSPGAPAHHFGDKNGLLAAIAAQGFRDMVALRQHRVAEAEAAAQAEGETDDAALARGRLRALLLGHLEFARAHPARFHLMYGPQLARSSDYPELDEAGKASFSMLRNAVLAVLPATRADLLTDDELAHIVWASVHGLAMLRMNRLGAPVRSGPQQNARQMGEALVRFCLLAIQGLAEPGDAPGTPHGV